MQKERGIFPDSKRGQMTLFIIAAILLVGVIAVFFVFQKIIPEVTSGKEVNPNLFLKTCIEDKIREAVDLVSKGGGYIDTPFGKTFKFSDETSFHNITYLCYNKNYYEPCITQQPMLIRNIKKEIKNHIEEEMESCFDDMVLSLKKQNYEVEPRYGGFNVRLIPGKITVFLDSEISVALEDEKSSYKDFELNIATNLYELANLAQEIASQESRFCYFEHLGYMLLYPEIIIDKFRVEDSATIYTLQHARSREIFRFAVKGCLIPPGLF